MGTRARATTLFRVAIGTQFGPIVPDATVPPHTRPADASADLQPARR